MRTARKITRLAMCGFGYALLAVGVSVILLGYASVIASRGVGPALEMLSPWNVANVLATIVVLLPGVACLKVGELLQ